MNTKATLRSLTCVASLTIALSACSTLPSKPNPVVESARHAYIHATQDISLVRHAADELDRAKFALQQAQKHEKNKQKTDAEHFAYIAQQRVKIAKLIAEKEETSKETAEMVSARRALTLDLREKELEKKRRETAELEQRMALLEADNTKRAMLMTMGDIRFEPKTDILTPASAKSIDKIVLFLNTYPEREIVIEGHTDSVGDARVNLKLSRNRAIAVRDELIRNGIDGSRISTQGYGEAIPIANNRTEAGRRQNRRVELVFPNPVTHLVELEE